MKTNAKHLILDLLLAADNGSTASGVLSVRKAIVASQLFGIQENSVRVTLARLAAEGFIEAAGRGNYRLGPNALELAGEVANWRTAEQCVRPWSGEFIAAHTGALGRANRPALRKRERALGILGFRELERGLFVRPDNIEADISTVRQRLYSLGLEKEVTVFIASEFEPQRSSVIHSLWNGAALNASYLQTQQQLEQWLRRADQLEPDVAARESFLLGGHAIRQVVFDPLLPAPFVDVNARQQFVAIVKQFDQVGHSLWQRFYELKPIFAQSV